LIVCKQLCDDEHGQQSCQDCGKLICFDTKLGDDIMRPAYVTSSGDLYCDRCGREHDRAEEEEYADFTEDDES
jgi:hypothetical protein